MLAKGSRWLQGQATTAVRDVNLLAHGVSECSRARRYRGERKHELVARLRKPLVGVRQILQRPSFKQITEELFFMHQVKVGASREFNRGLPHGLDKKVRVEVLG